MNRVLEKRLRRLEGQAADAARLAPESPVLEDLIARGADQVAEDAPPDELNRAERNFRLLLAAAGVNAQERGVSVLDDEAVQYALRLCPLWPFC
jgi:hypothetical protein